MKEWEPEMKKLSVLLCFFAFALSLIGCQKEGDKSVKKETDSTKIEQQQEMVVMGYVLATRENAILIVNDKLIKKTVNGKTVEHIDATWVTTEENVEIGTYVKIQVEEMSGDFPKTAVALPEKMEIVVDIIENSDLTKAEAIQYTMKEVQKVYQEENININEDIPCVVNVEYKEDKDTWAVSVRFSSSTDEFLYIFDDVKE